MTETESPVLEHLRHIRSAVDSVRERISAKSKGGSAFSKISMRTFQAGWTVWMRASSASKAGLNWPTFSSALDFCVMPARVAGIHACLSS